MTSRRGQQPITINSAPGDLLEELANVTSRNSTVTKSWRECNVILFPFCVFGLFCLVIVFVLFRYRLCANEEEEKQSNKDKS